MFKQINQAEITTYAKHPKREQIISIIDVQEHLAARWFIDTIEKADLPEDVYSAAVTLNASLFLCDHIFVPRKNGDGTLRWKMKDDEFMCGYKKGMRDAHRGGRVGLEMENH